MKTPHPFTTIDDQIRILQSRKLDFRSVEKAKEALSLYGYYNIINGYKDNYVNSMGECDEYKDGTTFEQIYSLFSLDHAVRNQIMLLMLDVEEMLKASAAYVVGENCGHLHEEYLDITKYRNKQKNNPAFSLGATISKLKDVYNSGKDPIRHNRVTYGDVPPWVLFKGTYFSTIVTFIGFFKGPMKAELISMLYDIPQDAVTPEVKRIFMDSLLMFTDYRNLCAHAGRAYNFSPKYTVRSFAPGFSNADLGLNFSPDDSEPMRIGMLLTSLALFKKRAYAQQLLSLVERSINTHCTAYPDDLDYLLDSMGVRGSVEITT